MRRRVAAVLSVLAVLFTSTLLAQENRDGVPLNDWRVPFEQIRAKVMETQPRRIAERSLHPSVNAVPSAASHFITIVPCRVVDTRLANGSYGSPKLVGGASRTFNIPGGPCTGIPTTAAAYSLNFTVLNGEGSSGFLTAYPTGSTRSTVSTLNFGVGNLVANAAIVPGGTSASIDVYVNYNVDIIIDINGYFVEGVVTSLAPGTGLTGGGTGNVTLGLAPGGVTNTQLAGNAVSTGTIQDNAVTATKIASGQVVKSISGLTNVVDILGASGTTVSTTGNTIQITAAASLPAGTTILGDQGDTALINAGYTEVGPFEVDGWRATSLTNPPATRFNHTAVWTGTKMIVWGGITTFGFGTTGGQYDPATDSWTATSTTNAPSPRSDHTAVWASSAGVMIVWGGRDLYNSTLLNTGGRYDPATNSWTSTSTSGAPAARSGQSGVWTGTYMVIWGGYPQSNTGGRYRPVQDDWTATSLVGAPDGRYLHTAVWTGSSMIVWGGYVNPSYVSTGGRYNPTADTWTPTSNIGAPGFRGHHSAVWASSAGVMIVWGGYPQSNTGGRYDPVGDTWIATTTTGAPVGRTEHTAVWTGQKMIVWGGYDFNATVLNTGGEYDPSTDSWSAPLPTFNAPTARYGHTAVWANDRMIIWGGIFSNTGGQWIESHLSLYQKN